MTSILDDLTAQPVHISSQPMWVTQLTEQVQAGFPSPAEDLGAKRIDLTAELIKHPAATFLIRARGTSMTGVGIFEGDVLIIDRAIKPKHGQVVVAMVDGDFTVKTLYQRAGRIKLQAANVTYPDILFKEGQELVVWGVVTHAIKRFKV